MGLVHCDGLHGHVHPDMGEVASASGKDLGSLWSQAPALCSCHMIEVCAPARAHAFHFHVHQITLHLDGLISSKILCFM